MTGSHEVRGSIPLGSTNIFKQLGVATRLPLTVLCVYSRAKFNIRDYPVHILTGLFGCLVRGRMW
jgi:hypothetical protein